MDQAHIDELLERYLELLDIYTRLRQELSSLHASVFQDIARANFSGERGLRYGQDQYDERMQATKRLLIEHDNPSYLSVKIRDHQHASDTNSESNQYLDSEDSLKKDEEQHDIDGREDIQDQGQEEKQSNDTDQEKETSQHITKDPLRWFGLFVPSTLRSAQRQSLEVVTRVVPHLVSVNQEMLELEIEIRRARKKRAKARRAPETKVEVTV